MKAKARRGTAGRPGLRRIWRASPASFDADGEWRVSRARALWFRNGGFPRAISSPGAAMASTKNLLMERLGNFFAELRQIKPNAITCDLSRSVSQALDCETSAT